MHLNELTMEAFYKRLFTVYVIVVLDETDYGTLQTSVTSVAGGASGGRGGRLYAQRGGGTTMVASVRPQMRAPPVSDPDTTGRPPDSKRSRSQKDERRKRRRLCSDYGQMSDQVFCNFS